LHQGAVILQQRRSKQFFLGPIRFAVKDLSARRSPAFVVSAAILAGSLGIRLGPKGFDRASVQFPKMPFEDLA
jgi:hypothetical protein